MVWLAMMAVPAQSASVTVYSNVCLVRETDDYGGIELQLRHAGGQDFVILNICEGGCYSLPARAVSTTSNRITFIAKAQWNASGDRAGSDEHSFIGTFGGNGLSLESPGYFSPLKLRRQPSNKRKQTFGAAKGGDISSWPMPVKRCSPSDFAMLR